jgi:prepilin-type N-terminal cleavage/methylation domain-containing protein
MRRRLVQRLAQEERGVTLPEVLVVIIIIGLLASIAYAVFLGQKTKAQDAAAKDNTAALVTDVESCRVDSEDFQICATKADLAEESLPIDTRATLDPACDTLPASGPNPGTPPSPGKVAVIAADRLCYVVMSRTVDGHFFWVWHPPDRSPLRGCTPSGQGSCHPDPDSGDPTVGSWQSKD